MILLNLAEIAYGNFSGHYFVARRQKARPSSRTNLGRLRIACGFAARAIASFTSSPCRLRVVTLTTAANAVGRCDRSREVPPRARPIDRVRDNSPPQAGTGMPTHAPQDARALAAATET